MRPTPSTAFRWVPCPGSVPLGAQFPELAERPSAAEGTASHWAGAEMLLGRAVAPDQTAPNGTVLTEEMIEGADLWVEDVLAVAVPRGLVGHLQVEQRIAVPRVHEESEGRVDTWLFDQAAGVLYVWDYKFGRTLEEVVGHWQLVMEACGILDLLGVDGRTDQLLTVDLRIVQPRAYHRDGRVRSWRVKASDLRGYFNQLNHAAHAAMSPAAPLAAGPHCLYCPARHACPTLRRSMLSVADWAQTAQAEELPPDALGAELVLLEMLGSLIEARTTGVKTQVEAALRGGQAVGDWTLEQTYGRKKWTAPAVDVAAVGDLYGVDLRKPLDVITPTQAAKLKVDAAVIAAYSESPSTGLKLVRDTNLTNKARAAFGAK